MKKIYLFVIVLALFQPAFAANFNIPAGDVAALITAMTTANTNMEADIISLASASTYNISGVDNSDPMWGNSGLPKILNDFPGAGYDLLIQGNGATFNGGGGVRFFFTGSLVNLEIQNLTMSGGRANQYGGAILLGDGTGKCELTLSMCTFTHNQTTNNSGEWGGGAVYSRTLGKVTATDCLFENNTGSLGGALYILLSNLTAERCIFRNNQSPWSSGKGGAIYTDGAYSGGSQGKIIIHDCTIENNTSNKDAGGIFLFLYNQNEGIITNSTFNNNTISSSANSSGGWPAGGGLWAGGGSRGSQPGEDNLWNQGSGNQCKVTVTNSTFFGNKTLPTTTGFGGLGGAIYSRELQSFNIGNVTFAGNFAGWSGGAIHSDVGSNMTFNNTLFSLNTSSFGGNPWTPDNQLSSSGGAPSDGGNNLHHTPTGNTGLPASVPAGDPMLLPLANNGGPTQTMALSTSTISTNLAIDGGNGCPATDQRGIARIGTCDIGAYEFGGTSTTNATPSCQAAGNFAVQEGSLLTFAYNATDPDMADVLTLTATGTPMTMGATFTQTGTNPVTGTFSWTPPTGSAGTYMVTLTATDNGTPSASCMETMTLIVSNTPVNTAPMALNELYRINGGANVFPPYPGAITMMVGEQLEIGIAGQDVETAPTMLSLTPTGIPASASVLRSIQTASANPAIVGPYASFDITFTPGQADVGTFTVSFTVLDNDPVNPLSMVNSFMVTVQDTGSGGTGRVPTQVGQLTRFDPGKHAAWLENIPGIMEKGYIFGPGGGTFTAYSDSTATLTGQIINQLDPSITLELNLLYSGKMDWNTWSAAGRTYKSSGPVADANHMNWDYYLLDPASTIVGTGGIINGTTLRLTMRPANGLYGLQIGLGANDQNGNMGLSNWFHFAGPSYSGIGDVNTNGTFMNVPMPVSSVVYLPVSSGVLYQQDLSQITQAGNAMSYQVSPPFKPGHPDGNPQHGAFSLNSSGTFSFTPHASFNGRDRLYYQMTDVQNVMGGGKLIFQVSHVFPVVLTYFNGKIASPQSVLLSWGTSREQNSASFSIERSQDGIQFSEMGRVAAKGNIDVASVYSFTDHTPFVGLNHYRLRMVDLDNTSTYSDIIQIRFEQTEVSLSVFPVPATDKLSIHALTFSGKGTSAQVIDIHGKMIKNQSIEVNASGYGELSISDLPTGMYFIQLSNGSDQSAYARFVKE